MGLAIFDERVSFTTRTQILAADTTTLKQISGTIAAAAARLDNLLLTNSDGIDHKIVFWETLSGVNYRVGSVDVPAGAGAGGLPAVDAIPLMVSSGQAGILVDNVTVLSFSVEIAVVTGAVQCLGQGGYF